MGKHVLEDEILKEVFYDEITYQKYRDDTSKTDYFITHVPNLDKNGNLIKLRHGFQNDLINSGVGETARSFCNRHTASLVANASIWNTNNGLIRGVQIQDGKVIQDAKDTNSYTLGIKSDNTLVMYPPSVTAEQVLADGCIDAITAFYPMIQDGTAFDLSGVTTVSNVTERHPRNVIAQLPNKDILFLTCEGRTRANLGMTYDDIIRILLARGVTTAYCLDGGGSSQTVVRGHLVNNTLGHYNIAVGDEALRDNIGSRNGDSTDNGSRNTAVGSNTMCYNTTGYCNTAMCRNALHTNFTGYHNTAIGAAALSGNAPYVNGVVVPDDPKHGNYNTAVGSEALFRGNSDHNTAVGRSAAWNTKNGARNVAIGSEALYYNEANVTYDDKTTAGAGNTAVGTAAMKYMQDGSQATLVNNSSAIGYGARVSGDNQVQLGGSGTTTYSYGAVQSRSDQRDKTDIKDTELGLDFLLKVRPVDFRWDYRDDYQEIDEEGNLITHEKDGSRSGNRFHHGVIAQEIQEVIQKTGKDFGGLQDHKINGGTDVLSIGYEEFIAPIIKSIHELHKMVSDLSDRVSELENK